MTEIKTGGEEHGGVAMAKDQRPTEVFLKEG